MRRSMCGHENASLICLDCFRLCLVNTCHLVMLRLADKLNVVFSKYSHLWDAVAISLNDGYVGKDQGRAIIVLTYLKRPGRGYNPPHSQILNAWLNTYVVCM
jgi:hypothetical protein